MKNNLYVVFDKVAEVTMQLFQARNYASAIREFESRRKKLENIDDYKLYWIGTYDIDTIDLFALDVPEPIGEVQKKEGIPIDEVTKDAE